jgi:hypothetical protein
VPVTTAGLADIGAADLDPLEVLRCGEHLPQQLAVAGLDPGPLAQRQPRLGDPFGEIVAQALELAQVEDPGLHRDGGDAMIELDPAEGLGEEAGELALEVTDLAPQLRAGSELVDLDAKPIQAVSCEQINHQPDTECRSQPGSGKPGNG